MTGCSPIDQQPFTFAFEQVQTTRELVDGLCANDPQKIRDALRQAQSLTPPVLSAQRITGATSPASTGQAPR